MAPTPAPALPSPSPSSSPTSASSSSSSNAAISDHEGSDLSNQVEITGIEEGTDAGDVKTGGGDAIEVNSALELSSSSSRVLSKSQIKYEERYVWETKVYNFVEEKDLVSGKKNWLHDSSNLVSKRGRLIKDRVQDPFLDLIWEDTNNVRSVCFHPSGEYLLAGTDHPVPHLYDINTFKCYLSANAQDLNANAAINQVRYSTTGSIYVTASKDGSICVWDGVTAQFVTP